MSHQLTDYLSRETADYLDQLERALAGPGQADPDQVLQLTRGARGSAEMAGLVRIGRVAELLEVAARSHASGQSSWSATTREAALETVRDLKQLVGAVHRWGPGEDALADRAAERWTESQEPEIVPIASLFFDDDGPHILSGPEPPEEEIVPIGDLLLKGDAALREALRLRAELERLLGDADPPRLREVVAELFELIELAIPPEVRPDE